jgi:broad specificity phosphatase PhoE
MSISGSAAAPPDAPGATPHPSLRIHLIRHAESAWNSVGRIQGQLDPPLSEQGVEQARRLAARLGQMKFDGFYTSDLQRAAHTAACVAEALGQAPIPVPALREIFLGEWEGLDRARVQSEYPDLWSRWTEWPTWDLVPGGEGAEAFEQRVRQALAGIVAQHPTGEILIVTHGGVIQVALAEVLGRGSDGPFPFRIDNTSVTVLQKRQERTVVNRVNDTCHLN